MGKLNLKLNWVEVKSSNIKAIAFEDDWLYVEFTNGSIYRYKNVPKEYFENLKNAESVGKYFSNHIRPNYYHEQIKLKD